MTQQSNLSEQAELVERVRTELAGARSSREVPMFGGLSFMVNEKMIVSALKDGALLVRVAAEQHDELTRRGGATQAQMGKGRDMGPGWIQVSASSIASDSELAFWLDRALEFNRTATGKDA